MNFTIFPKSAILIATFMNKFINYRNHNIARNVFIFLRQTLPIRVFPKIYLFEKYHNISYIGNFLLALAVQFGVNLAPMSNKYLSIAPVRQQSENASQKKQNLIRGNWFMKKCFIIKPFYGK